VQAGAPGAAARPFDTSTLSAIGGVAHTEADVRFMRGMIPHHAQALDMTALVPARAASDSFRGMALRMQISQRDEIALLTGWLTERREDVPPADAHRMMLSGGMPSMPGMLTEQQMTELEAASGENFERLFLEFMIIHHEGAIAMVQELFNSSGAGEETLVFWFASEVDSDQTIEIQRMRQMLAAGR